MLIYALAAALIFPSQTRPAERPSPTQSERFGAWEILVTVDPVTDGVSIGAYLGTPTDELAIACAQNSPDSTIVAWRSTTRFRETGYVPETGESARLTGWPIGRTTYRFDQDPPVHTWVFGRQGYRRDFNAAATQAVIRRIVTSSRLTLRDTLYETHTVVFDLVPADTLHALQRLDEVCGTHHSDPSADAAETVPGSEGAKSAPAGATDRRP